MVNVKTFESYLKDGARPNLFDVDIEGDPGMKYLIEHIQFAGCDAASKSMVRQQTITLVVLENEDYDAVNSFPNWMEKLLTMRAYKKNGDIAYTKVWKVTGIAWQATYDWEVQDELLTWDVTLTVEDADGIEN